MPHSSLTLLVLNLGLDVLNRVGRFDLQGDGLARQSLDKDLHAAAQAQHQVQRRLLLDVVVRQRAAVLQLLARKDQALLVRRDACRGERKTERELITLGRERETTQQHIHTTAHNTNVKM